MLGGHTRAALRTPLSAVHASFRVSMFYYNENIVYPFGLLWWEDCACVGIVCLHVSISWIRVRHVEPVSDLSFPFLSVGVDG